MSDTPRTDAIVRQLVTNVMHHWIRRDDYYDKEQLPRRVEDSFDNYYGDKPTQGIRALERELTEAKARLDRLDNFNLAAVEKYLKPGQTVVERMDHFHKEALSMLTLLKREKIRAETAEAALRERNERALLPDPSDERDVSVEWLRKEIHAAIDAACKESK